MFTALIAIHVIVSIILIVVVLLQAGKGASIGAAFGGGAGSQTLFGSAGPATFLGKMTAICALVFMITSISLTYLTAREKTSSVMSGLPGIHKVPLDKSHERPAGNK